jgi:hypothetical protein
MKSDSLSSSLCEADSINGGMDSWKGRSAGGSVHYTSWSIRTQH